MKLLTTALCLCIALITQAQVKDTDVLFTVDGEPVKATEFIRVYNKNLELVKDESQKDIDAYLDLFVNYQLKVKEARRLELDKDEKYLREFNNYKNQLTKNYMSDNKVTDALVKEAYERTTNDVKASHILVRIDQTETDTLAVYNQLLGLRERILNEGFETVQKEVHNGQTIFAEDLGYFGGFKMVYPFETAAFNTPVGEVSMPFRTRFGYHVVKVQDKRKALGEVTVAHIMVSNKQKDSTVVPEDRIKQIYKKIQEGEKFESLAKQFSDDKSSSNKGGVLSPFKGGQLSSKAFEDVAFSLEHPNDISEPFKTDFGWHIVKLIRKKGIQPFEEVKVALQNKVKRDTRSKLINSAMVKKLMTQYNVKENAESLTYFESILNDDYFNQAWKAPENFQAENILITIDGNTTYSNKDFLDYLMANQRKYYRRKASAKAVVNTEYQNFLETKVLKYREDNLEFENEDFAFVLKEYRDGLLLFDLMEKEVWNAASKDSVGLENYYNNHQSSYVWNDRIDAVILSSASKSAIEKAKQELINGTSEENILKSLNATDGLNVITTPDIFEKGDPSLPEGLEFKTGISKIYQYNDAYHVIKVNNVLPAANKTLDEARGKVVSDYQNYIEENWVKDLNERFEVKVDNKVLKRVKKQILK
ncbi:peptidylprolyl isomerase [Psychroserpens sp. MEBiC05023]